MADSDAMVYSASRSSNYWADAGYVKDRQKLNLNDGHVRIGAAETMVKILSILAVLGAALMLFSAPWLSALAYATVSIVQPQYVWFWSFEGFPIFKITAGLAIIAWLIQAFRHQIDWGIYRQPIVLAMPVLWLVFQLSNLTTPFPPDTAGARADIVMSTMNIIVLMFLVMIGLIRSRKAIEVFAIVMVLTGMYYTYWANDAYLAGDWSKFYNGRLNGPPKSPYRDGNVFSILFVVSMPFILFGLFHFKSRVVKISLMATLPLLWHAIVLCSSRGALLSICVATLFAAFMVRSRILNIALALGFVLFMVFQGGPIIKRSLDTVEASQTQQEEPLNPRLVSWATGLKLMKEYPLLGAGPQRFRVAGNALSADRTLHVAHSTFISFGANTGLIAAFIYLLFFYQAWKIYRRDRHRVIPGSTYDYLNKSCACALVGFFVGAVFLDLIIWEPFYFILLIMCANHHLIDHEETAGAMV